MLQATTAAYTVWGLDPAPTQGVLSFPERWNALQVGQ